MKKIPKNEPKRLGKNIVFHIPEASAEERLLERSRRCALCIAFHKRYDHLYHQTDAGTKSGFNNNFHLPRCFFA